MKRSRFLLIGAGSLAITVLVAARVDQRKAPATRPPPVQAAPASPDSWLPVGDPSEVPPALAARSPAAPPRHCPGAQR